VLSGRTAAVKINGADAVVSPAPVITRSGSVLVPLRGVLEKLNANVTFVSASKSIEVRQNGKLFILREGQLGASAGEQSIALPAAPQRFNGSVYVPLRALAELFGYRVEWDNAAKTVLIDTSSLPLNTANHRAALNSSRRFGVGIDFTDATLADIPVLLDAAKAAGVDIVQTRFDWHTIQPTKGATPNYAFYDVVVAEARKRNLVVSGILGNSAQWASQSRSTNPFEWRHNVPKATELASWSKYVQQTVAHFRGDVHAWQVWDQPTSWKLRSAGYTPYGNLVRVALEAARKSDPKAIIHAGEPGGVNLLFLNAIKNDPNVSTSLDGVRVYPASQFQPGLPVAPEDALLPFNAFQSQLAVGRDKWVGGLWFPAVEREGVAMPGGRQFAGVSAERREEILNTFTPQAQSDYLLKSAALAIAAGADKVLWNALRDDAQYEAVEPVNPEWGSGLLRRDNSPRPAYNALATAARLIGDPSYKYIGALATGPDVVALAFDNAEQGHIVAWSPSGRGKITVNDAENPNVGGAVYIKSRADSQVLLSNGDPTPLNSGSFELGSRALWITRIAKETADRAREEAPVAGKYLQVTRPLPRANSRTAGRATFGAEGEENGLLWRKYTQWRGQAVTVAKRDGATTLTAEIPPDVTRPADGKPFLFFDVADDLAFFNRPDNGTPTVKIRLRKAAPSNSSSLTTRTAGFSIEYSTPAGPRSTRWQPVEEGEGWVEYTVELPNATFSNADGSDFTINTIGSKQNLYFSDVSVALNSA
jgi:hypothetical protein